MAQPDSERSLAKRLIKGDAYNHTHQPHQTETVASNVHKQHNEFSGFTAIRKTSTKPPGTKPHMNKLTKPIIRLALITAAILLVPLVAMQFSDDVVWTLSDFIFAGVLIFGTGLLYLLATTMRGDTTYRVAAGLALAATFLLIWINGAVGIIGDSDINILYVLVPVVGFIGALVAGFRPRGMMRALFATAFAQFLVPIIAFAINTPDFSPGVVGVFVLNTVFVMLFAGSGLLFQQAARANGEVTQLQ